MRWPPSTPAGIRTLTERTFCSVPVPWQTGHGVSNNVPRPMQSGQTVLSEKRPWLSLRLPVPPQRGHVCVDVPGAAPLPRQFEQRTSWGTLTDVVTPCTASWKDRCSCASMSAPRCGPRCVRVPPVRKRPPKRSPRSPMSSMRKVPPLPGVPKPPRGPCVRTSSYSLRFSASPSTSYAALISLKRSSEPGLASGWCSFASFL